MSSSIYDFDWDPVKATSNASKHGVAFNRAMTVFSDSRALSIFDAEHSKDEERWLTLGMDSAGVLLVVSHTFRCVTVERTEIRIISARKAGQSERKQYATGRHET